MRHLTGFGLVLAAVLCCFAVFPGCGGGGDADGDTQVDGDTAVDGDTTADGDTAVDGDSVADGDTAVDGDTVVDGDTGVDGDTVTDGDTAVDGDAAVDGDTAPDGDTAMDGDTAPDGDTGSDGDAEPDGESIVDGDTVLDGDAEPDGDTTANADLTWIRIPGGTFEMGCSPNDSDCEPDESPRHSVTVATFEITQTEITQDQYYAVTGERPSYFASCGGTCPVDEVNWHEAKAFCEAVGGRLPSEAEWEYAARGGTTSIWSCGNDPSCLDAIAWYKNNSDSKTHPVRSKDPNGYGLYDMSGNVWEWCQDWYHDTYTNAPADGSAWENPTDNPTPVGRGGSWGGNDGDLRVSHRGRGDPGRRWNIIGMRCSRDVQ